MQTDIRAAYGRGFKCLLFAALLSALLLIPAGSVWSTEGTLAWDPSNSSNLAGYKVFYRIGSGSYAPAIDAGMQTSYTVTNIPPDSTVYFAVTAYNSSGAQSNPSPELACNTVTADAGPNGSVTPSGARLATVGQSRTYQITPAAGYHVDDVQVDGVSVGAVSSHSFDNITECHTISATFARSDFTLSAGAQAGGSILPSGSTGVALGSSKTYAITPATGYLISDVLVDGASVGTVAEYSFSNITANHTISARFTPIQLTITANAGAHGTISPSGSTVVNYGTSKSFSIAPLAGYKISNVLVDGTSVGAVPSYTYNSVTAAHTISASFESLQPPIAKAGPDRTVKEGVKVVLYGLNSLARDGDLASYKWTQTDGPKVVLSDATTVNCSFTSPNVGTAGAALAFRLDVTDSNGLKASDTCIVNVTWVDQPPVAKAGKDKSVDISDIVSLNGSASTDPDDGIASYAWRQISGPAMTLTQADSAVTTFVASSGVRRNAGLIFELKVTDHAGLVSRDQVTINVVSDNHPPVANAGRNWVVRSGAKVTLNGAASSDPEGSLKSYHWTQVKGPPVAITRATSAKPSIVAPSLRSGSAVLVFRLRVTDANGLSSADQCWVRVNAKR